MSMGSQSIGQWSEILHKCLAECIRWNSPKIVLDAVIRVGKRPRHFELDGTVVLQFCLDEISVSREDEKGWNGNIRSRTVVSHDWLGSFTSGLAIRIGTLADIVGDDDASGSSSLRVSNLTKEKRL